ncbi:MAG: DUF3108 domain-containing protein [Desulfobacterales bacterium]|nr:DUF3108 domain-containing protein [Desulfobacterales bacterium]
MKQTLSPASSRRRFSVLRGLIVLMLLALPAAPAWAADSPPFLPGEKLTFQLRWGVIPAGEATLEVLPTRVVDGKRAHHFVLTARTNSFLDVFYKVRQRIDAYPDLGLNRSLLYEEVHTVGHRKRDARIVFDWENMEARYIDFGKVKKQVALDPGALDPLSVFYYSRMFDPSRHPVLERPVTDGERCVIGRAAFVGRESLRVQGKTYDTFLIEPELKDVGGVFEKSKDAKIQIWVTADDRRIPVRLRSKVAIGSFTGDLVSVKTPAQDPRLYSSRRQRAAP